MIILLFFFKSAYWGRDPSALPFGSFNNNGMGMIGAAPGVSSNSYDRHAAAAAHHNSTIAVAASQAASLAGLHSSIIKFPQKSIQIMIDNVFHY